MHVSKQLKCFRPASGLLPVCKQIASMSCELREAQVRLNTTPAQQSAGPVLQNTQALSKRIPLVYPWVLPLVGICFVMGGMLLHTINKTHTPALKLHVD